MAKNTNIITGRKSGKDNRSALPHEIKKDNGSESGDYLFRMSLAPKIGESTHWFQLLIATFFTAVIIMIARMAVYERPMAQFFWSNGNNNLTDFFSYYKMGAIITCAALALILLLYRVFTQSFFVKRSFAYIPMLIYSIFVVLSYIFSEYKLFALWGWNERFEGTLVLLSYMIMLFFIINTVNTEQNIKWIIYPLAVSSSLMGVIGVSQALDHDFFRTAIGKKLITPNWFWDRLDTLNFTFNKQEIYQTVYNINYVSFYLTLLIPLFGLIFIRSMMLGKEEPIWKKALWAALFTLLIYNLIGSASSGGLMGMAVVVFVALIVLNKRIIQWWKPIAILIVLTIIVAGTTYERWMPELTKAINGVIGEKNDSTKEVITSGDQSASLNERRKIDYIVTKDQTITISYEGNEIIFTTFLDNPGSLKIQDAAGENIKLVPTNVTPIYKLDDERFEGISLRPTQDEEGGKYYAIGTNGNEWLFKLTGDGPKYLTGMKKTIELHKVPAVGWENNQSFGSGRGYIWSRTIPMMKDTIVLGHGADTFCIYFPHEDYVGKYNSGAFSNKINIVVDKPHNMYFGVIIGTGGISLLALCVLWGFYITQSFLLYRKLRYDGFIAYVGVGIFLGICGYLVSGFVNDSSVSVMPLFYGLLGTGIAINMLLKKNNNSNI